MESLGNVQACNGIALPLFNNLLVKIEKVKFTPEQATKAQMGRKVINVLSLEPRQ
jgi:hypothetical protein